MRKLFKALAYLFAVLVAGVLALLAWALIANWHDEPLSEAMQQALQYTPPTEAQLKDNGYLILMGLDAPLTAEDESPKAIQDAITLGRQRLAVEIARRQQLEARNAAPDEMPPNLAINYRTDWMPEALRCPTTEADCFDWNAQHRDALQALVQQQRPLLQRLAAAADAPQFNNPAPSYWAVQLPPFTQLVRGHELWLMEASLQWTAGDFAQAMHTAEHATRLRTRLANDADLLITTMVALAMHYRELRWLSQASAHLPAHQTAVGAQIDALLAEAPPHLQHSLNGEMKFIASTWWTDDSKQEMSHTVAPLEFDESSDPPSWRFRLLERIIQLSYLPQQTYNLLIARFEVHHALVALPASEIDAAYEKAMLASQHQLPCGQFWRHMRNATGICIALVAEPNYLPYAHRIADVDGYRRLVQLQRLAQTQAITPAQIAEWLHQSPLELRNPYTLAPMQWDEASNSLVFEGKQAQTQNPNKSSTYRIALPPMPQ